MKFLRKIGRLSIIQWSQLIQYRVDLILWMTSEAAVPLISLAVWYAIAKQSHGGPSPQDTLTYYILLILVVTLTNAWGGYFLSLDILQGNIVKELMKPFSPFWNHILNNLVEKVIKLMIPLPLFILILWFFPQVFTPSLFEPRLWPIFLLSIALAMSLGFAFDIIFGVLAFWLEDVQQIRHYKETLQIITSGTLIPIAVMPAKIQAVVNVLPFRSIISTPIEILLGRLHDTALLSALSLQIAWLAITIIILYVLWHRGLKRYAPPGQ